MSYDYDDLAAIRRFLAGRLRESEAAACDLRRQLAVRPEGTGRMMLLAAERVRSYLDWLVGRVTRQLERRRP